MPSVVSQSGSTKATYTYLADGSKVQVADASGNGFVYLGSLIYTQSGSGYTLESGSFSEGRIVNSSGTLTPYYYTTDHLGSIRMITSNSGGVVEQNDYFPFGGKHTSGRSYSTLAGNRYKFNGKEEQTSGGIGYLDYGARMYDEVLGRWGTKDSLAEKYYGHSPYNYCLNNPILFVDPDGRKVRVYDKQAQINIINTLSKTEAQYLSFDKDGRLDFQKLNDAKSSSANITALKVLANSDIFYTFSTATEYQTANGRELLVGSKENGTKGVTLFPNAKIDPSPDQNVHIITSSKLTQEEQVSNTAHEAYGHGYFYELNRQGQNVNPYHQYKAVMLGNEWDSELKMNIPIFGRRDINVELENQIKRVEEQAINNFKSRK